MAKKKASAKKVGASSKSKPIGKKRTSKKRASKKASTRSSKANRPYPRETLEEAINLVMAIRQKNAGNTWDPKSVATAAGYSKGTNKFFYISAAARDFGLTLGTRDTAEISLTELGRELAFAETPEQEKSTRLRAFENVKLFVDVLNYYKGSSLPEMKYLKNTLENNFGLDPRVHEEFAKLFRVNCEYLGITEGFEIDSDRGIDSSNHAIGTVNGGSDFVTVAEPDTETGRVCFVAMPFSERDTSHAPGFFAEVLNQIIAPAGRNAGFKVVTARKSGSDVIHATIVNGLLDADLVIVDLTEHNPNVLFELGMRMAEDKPVVLIRCKGTSAIFDVDNMLRVEEYDPCLWSSTVETDLPRIEEHIRGAWDNRNDEQSYMKILRSKRN